MRPWFAAFALAALMAAACAPGDDGAAAAYDKTVVEAGAVALVEEWAKAGEERRFDDLKALYADDPAFVWIEDGRIAYRGHGAVAAGVDQAAQMNATIESDVSEISATALGPDAAAVVANVSISVKAESFGFAFDGALSAVAVRRDGAWKFLNGHLSSRQAEEPSPSE